MGMREALLIGFCKYVANSNENFFPRVSTLSKLLFALENLKKKKKNPPVTKCIEPFVSLVPFV